MYKSQVEGRKGMNEQNAVMQQHNVKGIYCEKKKCVQSKREEKKTNHRRLIMNSNDRATDAFIPSPKS